MTITSSSDTAIPLEESHLNLSTPLRWRGLLLITANEVYKGLLIQWSYKFNLLMESIMLITVFIGITFVVGNAQFSPERLPPSLLGFIVYHYASVAISNMAYNLRAEAYQGTLEQWYMSPAPSSIVQIGRTLSTFILTTLTIIPAAMLLMWAFDIRFLWRWEVVPIFIIVLLGIYGFGFVVGGAALIFKQVESLANMMQNLLIFLNGAFLPVDQFPEWLKSLALTLPTTQGIIVLRRILLDNEPLSVLWVDRSLLWLIIHSSLYLGAGLIIFAAAERVAKRRGLLGQY
jgi:ABC-2 type transport system permease protein